MQAKKLFLQLTTAAACGLATCGAAANFGVEIATGAMTEAAFMFEQETVKDAPFTALATTRSEQVLNDGNRIVNTDTVRISRDSAGRVRREPTGEKSNSDISISDPANKTGWMLNKDTKTAHQIPSGVGLVEVHDFDLPNGDAIVLAMKEGLQSAANANIDIEVVSTMAAEEIAEALKDLPAELAKIDHAGLASEALAGLHAVEALSTSLPFMSQGTTETKPLGQKKISGVRVEGTRYTTTIEAGAIGNEAPIVTTKTTWYAPELRLMMSSEESDPRFGTISYRVEMENQKEPDAALFEVPADYKTLD